MDPARCIVPHMDAHGARLYKGKGQSIMAYCIQVLYVLCQAPTLDIMETLVHGNADLDDIDGTKGRLLRRAIYVYFILMAARIQPCVMDPDSCLSPQLSMSWTKYDTSIHPSRDDSPSQPCQPKLATSHPLSR